MSIQYGYYLPLGNVYDSVRFVSISAKMTGFGSTVEQKRGEEPAAMENFSITTSAKTAEAIGKVAELTPIKLVGLSGGKWAKTGSDRTEWSFQISSIESAA